MTIIQRFDLFSVVQHLLTIKVILQYSSLLFYSAFALFRFLLALHRLPFVLKLLLVFACLRSIFSLTWSRFLFMKTVKTKYYRDSFKKPAAARSFKLFFLLHAINLYFVFLCSSILHMYTFDSLHTLKSYVSLSTTLRK